jgi:hypothetical protein
MRCGATARGVLVTAVRVRAGRFVAAESATARREGREVREGREEKQLDKNEKLLLFFAPFADFAPFASNNDLS